MNDTKPLIWNKLIPFFVMGMLLVLFVVMAFFLFYILIWGFIVGCVLYGIVWIKERFFSKSSKIHETKKGRVIEYDENDN